MGQIQRPSTRAERGRKERSGLSLVELLVAVGVFSVVVLLLGWTFISISRLQRRAFRDAAAIDNARFAIETMSRTLRTVSSDAITQPSGNGTSSSVEFSHSGKTGSEGCPDPALSCMIAYRLDDHQILETNEQGEEEFDSPLTSSSVAVDRFIVKFAGRELGDCRQPLATIALGVRHRDDPDDPRFRLSLATTVSLRPLDLEATGLCP